MFLCEKMLDEIKKTACHKKIEILGQLSDVYSDGFWVLGTYYLTDCTLLGHSWDPHLTTINHFHHSSVLYHGSNISDGQG